MKALKIETFIHGSRGDTLKVPLALAKLTIKPFLNRFNSDQADTISSALNSSDFEGIILEVEEHKTDEKIVFSII